MRRLLALLGGLLLSAICVAATVDATLAPTTKDELGGPLPASGPGSLLSHRWQAGTCNGEQFGTVLQEKIVAMPDVTVSFTGLPAGLLCLRAYPRNSFAESKEPYPVGIAGPGPGVGGTITIISRRDEP